MAERLNAAVLKTAMPKGIVGSNPTPSATCSNPGTLFGSAFFDSYFEPNSFSVPACVADHASAVKIRNKIVLGFGAALVMLAIIAVVTYRSTRRLLETTQLVAHSRHVLETEESLR